MKNREVQNASNRETLAVIGTLIVVLGGGGFLVWYLFSNLLKFFQ